MGYTEHEFTPLLLSTAVTRIMFYSLLELIQNFLRVQEVRLRKVEI